MNRLLHGLVLVGLIAMAGLQLNDPDPLLWVAVYLSVAAVVLMKLLHRKRSLLYGIATGMVIACLLVSFPGFIDYLQSGDFGSVMGEMSAHKPYVEPAREFLGTVIAAVCLAGYWRWHTS